MRYPALVIGFLLLLSPGLAFAQAQTPSCSAKGYTVVYINGVFGDLEKAKADVGRLKFIFSPKNPSIEFNGEPVDFENGFNPSELGGVDDGLKTLLQLHRGQTIGFNEDHDADLILANMFSEVKTQKILLVGHSQGAFYTNEIYKYLVDNGVPVSAISVYNIATPANYSEGGGTYLTSSNDSVINGIRKDITEHPLLYGTNQPLTANITIEPQGADDTGHLFVQTYLNGAPQQIVSDIQTGLAKLEYSPMPNLASGCFNPPSTSFINKVAVSIKDYTTSTGVGVYVVGAGTVNGSIAAVKSEYAASIAFLTGVTNVAVGFAQFVADTLTLSFNRPTDAQATTKTNTVVSKLYGSSLDGLSAQDRQELLGSAQGGAVALALAPKAPEPTGEVLGTSTELAVDVSADTAPTSTPSTTPDTAPSLFPQSSNGPVWGGGGNAPTPPVVATVADDSAAVVPDDSASSTPDLDDEASSTPPVEDEASSTPPAPALPTGAPIVDNFDSYSADPALSAWTVVHSPYNANRLFGADDGSSDTYGGTRVASTSDDCHAGGCVIAIGQDGGLGGGGSESYMYKESGVAQDSGAFTIWARSRVGYRAVSANVGLCAGASLGCENVNNYWFDPLGTNDDAWHRYYLAWRQGSTTVETCVLQDSTSAADCSWHATLFAAGTQFDGIFLAGGVPRPDLGDQVWFDDLENAPQ